MKNIIKEVRMMMFLLRQSYQWGWMPGALGSSGFSSIPSFPPVDLLSLVNCTFAQHALSSQGSQHVAGAAMEPYNWDETLKSDR